MQSFLKKLKRFCPTLHELFKNARNRIPKSFNHLKNSSWWFSKTSWRIIEKGKENLTVFLDVFCVTAYIPANRVSTYYISITCYGRNRFFSLHSCHSDFTCRNDRNYRLSCKTKGAFYIALLALSIIDKDWVYAIIALCLFICHTVLVREIRKKAKAK